MSLFSSLSKEKNWEIKYALLIEAGKQMSVLPESERSPDLRVPGCNAPTWIKIDSTSNHLSLSGYSKSHVVLGLLALVREYVSTHTLKDLQKLSPQDFAELGLSEILTPTRQNGFVHILQTIQDYARKVR